MEFRARQRESTRDLRQLGSECKAGSKISLSADRVPMSIAPITSISAAVIAVAFAVIQS